MFMKLLLSKCKLWLFLIILFVICSSGLAKFDNIYVQPLIAFSCAYSGTRVRFEDSIHLMLIVPFLAAMLNAVEIVGVVAFFMMLVFFAYRPLKKIKIFIIGFLLFSALEFVSAIRYISLQTIFMAAFYNTLIFMVMRKLCEIWFPSSQRNIFI